MKFRLSSLLLIFLIFLLIPVMTGSLNRAVSKSAATPKIISFYAGTSDAILNLIDYNLYDYFFVTDSGEITLRSILESYDSAADVCHNKGVKFLLSLYSDDTYPGFYNVIHNASARQSLVTNIKNMLVNHNYDGVNIDFEYDVDLTGHQPYVDAFITDLYDALHPYGKLIGYTSQWYAGFGDGSPGSDGWDFSLSVANYIDLNNVMTYDMWDYTPPAGQPLRSSYQQTIEAMNRWVNAGYPKDRLYMGIPFFSEHSNGSKAGSYSGILDTIDPSADVNVGYINGSYRDWNGMSLVKQKTSYVVANSLGGVMLFTAPMDKLNDSRSLLQAIYDIFNPDTPLPKSPSVKTENTRNITAVIPTMPGIPGDLCSAFSVNGGFEYALTPDYGSLAAISIYPEYYRNLYGNSPQFYS